MLNNSRQHGIELSSQNPEFGSHSAAWIADFSEDFLFQQRISAHGHPPRRPRLPHNLAQIPIERLRFGKCRAALVIGSQPRQILNLLIHSHRQHLGVVG